MFVPHPDVLHADIDAFYASVEQRDNPRLRGKPVVVGGGVVLAASYEARAYGVHAGMGGRVARRLCPHLVVAKPRWPAYSEASKAVFEHFYAAAPDVEKLSIDEAFLHVAGLQRISGSPPEIADRLRREVRERVGLKITIGVARTRLLAKIASGVAKPDGLLVVQPEAELEFVLGLRVEQLYGVGKATTGRLNAHGIETVAQAAKVPEPELVAMLGRGAGRYVYALARNRDPRPRRPRRRRRSYGSQSALGSRRPRTAADLDEVLVSLVDRVTRRMRVAGGMGRTVMLRLRFNDFSRATRSTTLHDATAATRPILFAARALLAASMPLIERRGVTLVGITVAGVQDDGGAGQLVLPVFSRGAGALDAVLDEVRERYGPGALIRARLLGKRAEAWLGPDEGGPFFTG
jgi:DNA polymerase-4